MCSTLQYRNGRKAGNEALAPISADAGLMRLATHALEDAGLKFGCGGSVTVPQPASNPTVKKGLNQASRAQVVDMEGYWLAGIASEKAIPFAAIRAVSDARQDSLPPFDRILGADGSWLWTKAAAYFALHPQDIPRLLVLYRNSQRARRSLTDCIAYIAAGMG